MISSDEVVSHFRMQLLYRVSYAFVDTPLA